MTVYNLEVEQAHTYFVLAEDAGDAAAVWVHNANAYDSLHERRFKGIHDEYVNKVRPGAKEFPIDTSIGTGRRFDDFDLLTGTAFEGNTTPWNRSTWADLSRKMDQAAADFALLKDPASGVRRVIWFGTEPLPKTGPGRLLREALEKSGIEYWHVPV